MNTTDENYKVSEDDGYFFVGSNVEYNITNYMESEVNVLQDLMKVSSYLSYVPYIGGVFETGNIIYNVINDFKYLASDKIVEYTYTSEDGFSSGVNNHYTTRDGQIENYSNLIKIWCPAVPLPR